MDNTVILSFKKALEKTNSQCRTLLIGNGFSQSVSKRFRYVDLLELTNTKEKFKLPVDLLNVFNDLETVDFEKVIAYLEVSEVVLSSYSKNNDTNVVCSQLEQKIKTDKEFLKKAFIHAINYIHHNLAQRIIDDTYSKIGDFLYNFDRIFTLNYDLLLYWVLMRKMEKVGRDNFKFDDGFTRYGWGINNSCLNHQNVFYLHGALHLFSKTNLYKIISEEFDNITDKITEHIMNDKYPLTIMEGKHDNKKKRILKNSYLNHCYKKIKETEGSLFILGTSLNVHADHHIYTQIKHSNFDSIYFGIHDKDNNDLIERIKCLGWYNSKKINFFNSRSAVNWKLFEDEDNF